MALAQILPDWLGVLLFGLRYIENNGVDVNDSSTLNFTTGLTATFNATTGAIDVAAAAGAISSIAGTAPISCVTTSGVTTVSIATATAGVTGAMSGTDKTKLDAATVSPTPSSLCLRGSSGEVCGTWFETATANVATSGAIRLPAGAQTVVAVKGASHASVPLLALDSASSITIGDAVEITSVSFQAAAVTNLRTLAFDAGVAPSITQDRVAGTGTTASATVSIVGQQGQSVVAGTNNSGGGVYVNGGAVGSGGTGGFQGPVKFTGGGQTAQLSQNGFALPFVSLGNAVGVSTTQIALDIGAGGNIDLLGAFTTSTETGSILAYATSTTSLLFNPSNVFGMHFVGTNVHSAIVLDSGGVSGIQFGDASAKIGLFGLTPIVQPIVTGDCASNAALASLLTQLDLLGAIDNDTTNTAGIAAGAFLFVDVTVSAGTGTVASGKNLSAAKVASVFLKTAVGSATMGAPTAAFSANSVVVTTYLPNGTQATLDQSTYTVCIVGWA